MEVPDLPGTWVEVGASGAQVLKLLCWTGRCPMPLRSGRSYEAVVPDQTAVSLLLGLARSSAGPSADGGSGAGQVQLGACDLDALLHAIDDECEAEEEGASGQAGPSGLHYSESDDEGEDRRSDTDQGGRDRRGRHWNPGDNASHMSGDWVTS